MVKNDNIVRFKGNNNFNIGFVIFIIIIIYVLFNIFSYFTSKPVSVYEVLQGTIATNNVYKGLIVRDESIIYAQQEGYVNYYLKNSSKASISDIVYSVDTDGNISKQITSEAVNGAKLSESASKEFIEKIDSFEYSYDANNFINVLTFKSQLASDLSQTLSQNALNNLNDIVGTAEANNTFYKYLAPNTGIVSYCIDGFENISEDNFSKENFEAVDYNKISLDNKETVKISEPVYRLVNSENWSIIIQISDKLAEELNDNNYIKIKICEDDFTTNAACKILKKEGQYYLQLSLKHSMIRYINERFIDVELVLNSNLGLKIPNSSITEKEFYTVPKEFFSKGSDSDSFGLLVQNKDSGVTLVNPTIFYENENYFYIDDEKIHDGDIILKNDSSSTYIIGEDKDSLIGVYNINKGYAVFKQISIISQNDDYSIIETKTKYGIALYDHIALEGNKVKENQVIME